MKLISLIEVFLALFLAGCSQKIAYREYYPPSQETLTIRDDGVKYGALKVEATRDGVPNWSDNKEVKLSLFGK